MPAAHASDYLAIDLRSRSGLDSSKIATGQGGGNARCGSTRGCPFRHRCGGATCAASSAYGAAQLGAGDPDRVASQITLLINGAFVTGLITQPADLRSDLVDAAMKLVA